MAAYSLSEMTILVLPRCPIFWIHWWILKCSPKGLAVLWNARETSTYSVCIWHQFQLPIPFQILHQFPALGQLMQRQRIVKLQRKQRHAAPQGSELEIFKDFPFEVVDPETAAWTLKTSGFSIDPTTEKSKNDWGTPVHTSYIYIYLKLQRQMYDTHSACLFNVCIYTLDPKKMCIPYGADKNVPPNIHPISTQPVADNSPVYFLRTSSSISHHLQSLFHHFRRPQGGGLFIFGSFWFMRGVRRLTRNRFLRLCWLQSWTRIL